jgi:hypothetical protein
MRIATFAVSLVLALGLAACGDKKEDVDPFDTLQECYTEHAVTEKFPVQESIVVCCIDHPIAGVHPSCANTKADCVTHVRAALDASVSSTDIDAACTTYIDNMK